LLDVVVTDESNRILTELGPKDFRVYEDGVPQQLDSVQLLSAADERGSVAKAPTGQGPAAVARSAKEKAPGGSFNIGETYRYAVVLLDLPSMDVDSRVRLVDALQHWFQHDLPEHTKVAVLALTPSLRLLAPFSDKRAELATVIERLKQHQSDFAAADASLLQPLLMEPFLTGATEDPSGYQAGRVLDSLEVAQPELLKNPFTLRIIRAFLTMKSYVEARHAEVIFDAVQAVAEGLTAAPGRKLLILASEGLVVSGTSDRRLHQVVEAARESGVAIYVVQPQGLETHGTSSSLAQRGQLSELNAESAIVRKDAAAGDTLFDRAKVAGSDLPDATLGYLAQATGGFVVRNTNDLKAGLRNIVHSGMTYYLLTYRSSRPEYDGTIRRLRVEVAVPGVRVLHRTSYRAIPPGLEVLTSEQYQLWRAVELDELPLTLPGRGNVLVFPTEPMSRNVVTIVELPVEALELRSSSLGASGRWVGQLTLDFFLENPFSGDVIAARRVPLNLHLSQEDRETLGWLTLAEELAVFPGEWHLVVLLHDVLGGRAWRQQLAIEVPSPQSPVQVCDLVIGKRVEEGGAQSGLLTLDGGTLVPAVLREFHRQDRLIYYLRVCSSPDQLREVRFSLLEFARTSYRRIWHESIPWVRDGPTCRTVARWLPLTGLDPGIYFLRAAIVTTTEGVELKRTAWFRLKPQ